MTKEEAIKILNEVWLFGKAHCTQAEFEELVKMSIQALEQEAQTFKWCTDCREYDQEKHCCHRWSKVIRNTVEEMKQEPRKGHWIVQPSNKEQGERDFIWWKCSECGQVIFSETEEDRKEFHSFCGRCGADMREVVEDGKID